MRASRVLGGVAFTGGAVLHKLSSCEPEEAGPSTNSRLVFIGSGSSTGIPRPRCILPSNIDSKGCHVSKLAAMSAPHMTKNYRGNPSVVIHTPENKFIVIDVGKTFREHALRWFGRCGVDSLDAVVLTHDHADAIFGLDDLRGFQSQWSPDIPVYLDARTRESCRTKFPYLMPEFIANQKVKRAIARLDWRDICPWQSFSTCGVSFLPLPVMHGEDYESLGFRITGDKSGGAASDTVIYISDVSRIPEKTNRFLTETASIDVMEALQTVEQYRPKRAILIGMSDEIEHQAVNRELHDWGAQRGLRVELAYDGMCVDVNL